MATNETTQTIVPLVRAIRWPMVVVLFLFLFREQIAGLIGDVEKFIVKPGKIEASAKREGFEAGENYRAALEANSDGRNGETSSKFGESTFESLQDANLLWVDDRPLNNEYEQRALETLGTHVETAETTEQALALLETNDYDVILSDMGRPGDQRAGYTLLEEKQLRDDDTPFVIYSTSNEEEHEREARRRGAVGSTNRPDELFQLVEDALTRPERGSRDSRRSPAKSVIES